MMMPLPNDEHQSIVSRLTSILEDVIGWPGLGKVRPGVNVTDRTGGVDVELPMPRRRRLS